MEVTYSSEMSADFQQTTWSHISKDSSFFILVCSLISSVCYLCIHGNHRRNIAIKSKVTSRSENITCFFQPLKHERVVTYYGTERVILIKPNDSKSWLNKMKTVLNVVDKELGYVDTELANLSNSQVLYFFEL
jgi:hypothetical protein